MKKPGAASGIRLPGLFASTAASVSPVGEALAHDTLEGAGALTNGLLHPFVVPAHVLVLVGSGLLLGQRGERFFYPGLAAFSAALALGLGISGLLSLSSVVTLAGCMVLGLLIAADLDLPVAIAVALMLVMGLLIGLDSNPELLSGWDRFAALSGVWMASFAATIWLFLVGDSASRQWQRIGVRIVGSWVTAISIMVIALSFVA